MYHIVYYMFLYKQNCFKMLIYNDDYNIAANIYDFCRNYLNNASPKYMLAYICVCIKGRKGRI